MSQGKQMRCQRTGGTKTQYKPNEKKKSLALGPTITAALKEEIKNHKDEVVDVLFPILGKMVKKYVAQEMELLSEKINTQLGFKAWKRKMKSWFGGVKEEEIILSELSSAKIEQVLLIEKESGILKSSYSKTETIDEEEDAFGQANQNLELIEYELYHIHLQSFATYYIAVVISGSYSVQSKNKVQDLIFNFYEDFMKMNEHKALAEADIRNELAQNFGNASI